MFMKCVLFIELVDFIVFHHWDFHKKRLLSFTSSVETLFRWSGKRLHYFVANLFRIICAKFYKNCSKFWLNFSCTWCVWLWNIILIDSWITTVLTQVLWYSLSFSWNFLKNNLQADKKFKFKYIWVDLFHFGCVIERVIHISHLSISVTYQNNLVLV